MAGGNQPRSTGETQPSTTGQGGMHGTAQASASPDSSTPPASEDAEANQQPEYALAAGDLIVMTPQSVAHPGFHQPEESADNFRACFNTDPGYLATPGTQCADAILVLAVEPQGQVVGVRLGVMSTEAVANHLPDVAPKLSKPQVFFIGGNNKPVVLGVGFLKDPLRAQQAVRSAEYNSAALFGKNHQFLFIQTGEDAPSIDEQVEAVGGQLQGLRFFHSYVTVTVADVQRWVTAGYVSTQPAIFSDVFTDKPGETWRSIMARRPFPENFFSTWAQHPERN